MAVAAAFVAGTMTTGGIVHASFDQCLNNPPQGIAPGTPFAEMWAAICDLEDEVDSIDTQDDLLGFYRLQITESFTGAQFEGNVTTDCDDGDVAVSGGYSHGLNPGLNVVATGVSGVDPKVVFVAVDSPPAGSQITLQGICADFDPLHVP